MADEPIQIHVTNAEGSGVCERCGTHADQLYHVTLSQGELTQTHNLCLKCTVAAKRFAEKNKQEVTDEPSDYPIPKPAPAPVPLAVNKPAEKPARKPGGKPTKKKTAPGKLPVSLIAVVAGVLVIAVAAGIGISHSKKNDADAAVTTAAPSSETAPTVPPTTVPEDEDVDDSLIQKLSSVLIVDDAAYEYYNFSQSTADRYAGAVSRAADSLKGTARVFDLVVPTSMDITLSDKVRARIATDDQKKAIEAIYAAVSKNATTVNTFDALRAHRKEYVYFRTDHHWTALGAYYAYREFAAAAGLRPAELSEFTERKFENFIGAFYYDSGKKAALEKNPDTVYAYEPKSTNEMEFTDKKGNVIKWNIITDVSKWKKSTLYNTFIGGDNPYSHIVNPGVTDGSSCVVIKESFGNAFVPFLLANYGEIHVIDYRYWKGSLTEFVRAKGVKDVIYLNNTSATRNLPLVKSLDSISR